MKHVYEFEVFLDEGRYTVWPFRVRRHVGRHVSRSVRDGGRLAENRR